MKENWKEEWQDIEDAYNQSYSSKDMTKEDLENLKADHESFDDMFTTMKVAEVLEELIEIGKCLSTDQQSALDKLCADILNVFSPLPEEVPEDKEYEIQPGIWAIRENGVVRVIQK